MSIGVGTGLGGVGAGVVDGVSGRVQIGGPEFLDPDPPVTIVLFLLALILKWKGQKSRLRF